MGEDAAGRQETRVETVEEIGTWISETGIDIVMKEAVSANVIGTGTGASPVTLGRGAHPSEDRDHQAVSFETESATGRLGSMLNAPDAVLEMAVLHQLDLLHPTHSLACRPSLVEEPWFAGVEEEAEVIGHRIEAAGGFHTMIVVIDTLEAAPRRGAGAVIGTSANEVTGIQMQTCDATLETTVIGAIANFSARRWRPALRLPKNHHHYRTKRSRLHQ